MLVRGVYGLGEELLYFERPAALLETWHYRIDRDDTRLCLQGHAISGFTSAFIRLDFNQMRAADRMTLPSNRAQSSPTIPSTLISRMTRTATILFSTVTCASSTSDM